MYKIKIYYALSILVICLGFCFHTYATLSVDVGAPASFMDALDEKYHLTLDDNLSGLPLYTDGSLVTDPNPSISGVTMIYQGSPFFEYQPGKYLYKLLPDGTRDSSFDGGTGFDSDLIQVGVLPSGKILVVGWFSSYKGTMARKVVCLNPDGSIDSSYNAGGSGFGATTNYYPLLIQSDGKVIVMGDDYTYNGQAVSGTVRLNIDGTLDNTFNASYIRGGYGYGALQQPDGKIIIFGAPYNTNTHRTHGVVRLHEDGSRDDTFNSEGSGVLMDHSWIAVYNGVLDDDGNIILVGAFEKYNNISSPGILRLFPDGNLDQAFSANIGSGFVADTDAEALLLQPDGKILVGGWFSKFNGQSANRIIRLNGDGTIDTGFVYGNGFDSVMNKEGLHFLTDGTIEVHGYFSHYNGASTIPIDPGLAYSYRAFLGIAKPVIEFATEADTYDTGTISIPLSGSDPKEYTTGIVYQLNSNGNNGWSAVDVFDTTDGIITGSILLTGLTRGSYTVYIKGNNSSGDVSYPIAYSFFVNLPDTVPPVVTLKGSSQITISQGESFIDEGASRTDDVDGSGVILSPTSGNLQTDTPGVYVLEYTYTDHANHATMVSRIVTVIPKPFIVSVGGGGGYINKDICPQGDYSPSYYDSMCGTGGISTGSISKNLSGLSEIQLAYSWTLELGIFSRDQKVSGKITRAELAKIISIYATKILNKQPGQRVYGCEHFHDFGNDEEMNEYIKLSCNLGIMGLEADGKTPKKKFDPNRYVTKGEFGTALSRMLYSNKYDNNDGRRYRVNHLNKLKKESILSVSDPREKETRDHVALLLYQNR